MLEGVSSILRGQPTSLAETAGSNGCVVWTQGTDNRLVLEQHKRVQGSGKLWLLSDIIIVQVCICFELRPLLHPGDSHP